MLINAWRHYRTCSLWQELDLYILSLLRIPRKLAEVREPRYLRPPFLCDSLSTPIRSRIWVRSPTSSSSTLWLMTTEHSTNLQLHAVANILPSTNREFTLFNVYLTKTDIWNWQHRFWLTLCSFNMGNQNVFDNYIPSKCAQTTSCTQLDVTYIVWMLGVHRVGSVLENTKKILRSNKISNSIACIMIYWFSFNYL